MNSYEEYRKQLMEDPEFVREYEALEDEFNLTCAMIDARINSDMTQKELSEKTGISQADISRIESGKRSPSWNTIKRIAKGLGLNAKIVFTPEILNK